MRIERYDLRLPLTSAEELLGNYYRTSSTDNFII